MVTESSGHHITDQTYGDETYMGTTIMHPFCLQSSLKKKCTECTQCTHMYLLERLLPLLLQHLLHGEKPVFPQLNPLVAVADAGVFNESTKDHEEADAQVDVDGLHVGDLGEGGVHAGHQGGHGEHSGDPEADAGRGGAPVEPEGDPGHDYDEA